MKLIATALITLGFATLAVGADEPKATAKKASAAPGKKVVAVKAPFENHWSSNSWESGSAENFWRSTTSGSTAQPKKGK
ncbi:MAG: hypothetical protein P1U89_21070 [Verrucomicrobiales bacterium]|nr:hypothetical protein [Verrucomicrobiales bacterium]